MPGVSRESAVTGEELEYEARLAANKICIGLERAGITPPEGRMLGLIVIFGVEEKVPVGLSVSYTGQCEDERCSKHTRRWEVTQAMEAQPIPDDDDSSAGESSDDDDGGCCG